MPLGNTHRRFRRSNGLKKRLPPATFSVALPLRDPDANKYQIDIVQAASKVLTTRGVLVCGG
ncbi:MAG: hypothetical protein ABI782_07345 [Anaerolineaceae bacterium]